jgi:hypothetical protein
MAVHRIAAGGGPISRTLSRWSHGFEPRWDYEHKGPGQGTSLRAFGRLNRNSKAEYPENIPSRIERSEVRESPRVEGGCTGATASWHPHHCAVHGRTNGHRIGTSWSSVPLPSRSLRRRPPRIESLVRSSGRARARRARTPAAEGTSLASYLPSSPIPLGGHITGQKIFVDGGPPVRGLPRAWSSE